MSFEQGSIRIVQLPRELLSDEKRWTRGEFARNDATIEREKAKA
jgi:hypothetical protein